MTVAGSLAMSGACFVVQCGETGAGCVCVCGTCQLSSTILPNLNKGQSRVRLSYSPPSPHTLHPYSLQQEGGSKMAGACRHQYE